MYEGSALRDQKVTITKKHAMGAYEALLGVELSNGSLLEVYWDDTYSFVGLHLAPADGDFVACTDAEVGLPLDVVQALRDEVAQAAEALDEENAGGDYEHDMATAPYGSAVR